MTGRLLGGSSDWGMRGLPEPQVRGQAFHLLLSDQTSLSSLKWSPREPSLTSLSPKTESQEQGLTLHFLRIGAEGAEGPSAPRPAQGPPLGNLSVPGPSPGSLKAPSPLGWSVSGPPNYPAGINDTLISSQLWPHHPTPPHS